MKKIPVFLLLAGLSLSLHGQAQSFGDFLKNVAADAARNAVAGNVRQAVGNVVDSAAKSVTQPGAANTAPAASSVASPATPAGCARIGGTPLAIGARPAPYQPDTLWPENSCLVLHVADLKFEKATAAKHAYREASKVRCNDCEGGYWPDAWGWRSLVKDSRGGNYSDEFAKMLVALKEGESLTWKGNKFDGAVTATGSHPIGDLPCRQFHYALTEKGRLVAEYDSLLCAYIRPYASRTSWNEMI